MKTIFNEEQRAEHRKALNAIWQFMENLSADEVKFYSNYNTKEIETLAQEMGFARFYETLRDSQLRGHYNPRKTFFIPNPSRTTFYSFEDPYEMFVILKDF